MNQKDNHTLVVDLHYLPCQAFFSALLKYDKVVIEAKENYIKQTYRNRCRILTANKVADLSIPVVGGNKKVEIRSVQIDYTQKWLNNHWRTITSAYGKSPFFEFYEEEFHEVLFKKERYLFDLNWELLSICLKFLGINKEIVFSEKYQKEVEKGFFDAREAIAPKKNGNIAALYQSIPYNQVFGSKFVVNLSIIDLLFCEGPNALSILRQSIPSQDKLI